VEPPKDSVPIPVPVASPSVRVEQTPSSLPPGSVPSSSLKEIPPSVVVSDKDQIEQQRALTHAENLKKKEELEKATLKIKEEFEQKSAAIQNDPTLSPEAKESKINELIRIRSEKEIALLTSKAEGVESQLSEAELRKREKIRILEERQRMLEEQAKKPRLKALSPNEIEELWGFYFLHRFGHPTPSEFYGNGQAKEVLIRILQQINKIYDKYDPTQPIVEKQPGNTKIYYVGDLFGSFETLDLLMRYFQPKIFEAQATGNPIRIIFLGNYVDYNAMDLHALLYLFVFNLLYPREVLLLRGNHEERTMNQAHGFANNILTHFDEELLNEFESFFAKLPVIHIIDSNYLTLLAIHGGIPINVSDSRKTVNIRKLTIDCFKDDISKMDPNAQQLLWNNATTKTWKNRNYKKQSDGYGYEYREKIIETFLKRNQFNMVITGNQILKQGYEYFANEQLLSLFSAISYKDEDYNGKIMEIIFPPDPEYPEENEYEDDGAPDEEEDDEDEIYYEEDLNEAEESEVEEDGTADGGDAGSEGEESDEEEISVEVNLLAIKDLNQ
jgi:hypothetical protein